MEKHLSHKIKEINEGNERILAIEITHPSLQHMHLLPHICHLNPNDSHIDYMECLNIINSIISTYSESHQIILLGDLNGTLLPPRKSNKCDQLLQSFITEMKLNVYPSDKQTFFHHDWDATSQIDYILDNSSKISLRNFKIHEK